MKQTIYFCNDCGTPFGECSDGNYECPNCRQCGNIESYDYNIENGELISPNKVLVRVSIDVKNWFYEMSVKMMTDLLKIEVEIKNKRILFMYNLNSIISNIKYMSDIIGNWKTFILTEGEKTFVYRGYPGCLITEYDWKGTMEILMSLKHDAERLIVLVEKFLPVVSNYNNDGEPSWSSLEYEIDNMIKECRKMYMFFKYGANVPQK